MNCACIDRDVLQINVIIQKLLGYLPFLLMWMQVICADSAAHERYSNASVEETVKGRSMRCLRFIPAVREAVLSTFREYALGIDKKRYALGMKRKGNAVEEIDLEEQWNKRKKTHQNYFANHLKFATNHSNDNLSVVRSVAVNSEENVKLVVLRTD